MMSLRFMPHLIDSPRQRKLLTVKQTRAVLDDIFLDDIHAKRVASLANGVAGALAASRASIHAIGRAYAELEGIQIKSAVKQIDRLLSNEGIEMDLVLSAWVRFVAGNTASLTLAMDWTDFDADDHTTLCIYLVTRQGRALPFIWQTHQKSKLKGQQTALEVALIERLHRFLPVSIDVTLLADRGFGKTELYELLEVLGWDYVIRFRQVIRISSSEIDSSPAAALVPTNGRARLLTNVQLTGKKKSLPGVVLVKKRGMKDAWCLATSLSHKSATEIVKLYARRFTIEEAFRDTKDIHFGMGLSATHIRQAARRDRLLLLLAISQALLTLLGMAGERCKLDSTLKTNTVKHRTLSLLNQGICWYRSIPTMPEERLRKLLQSYEELVREHAFFCEIFAIK